MTTTERSNLKEKALHLQQQSSEALAVMAEFEAALKGEETSEEDVRNISLDSRNV